MLFISSSGVAKLHSTMLTVSRTTLRGKKILKKYNLFTSEHTGIGRNNSAHSFLK